MKKLITLLFLLPSILLFSQNLTDSLLIHYPFYGNQVLDISGNEFHGIFNAANIEDRFETSDEAVSFNGINQYIDLPNDSRLKPQLPVSFSYWVKFNDLNVAKTVVFTTDFGTDQHSGVWMNLAPGNARLAINYGDATGSSSTPDRRTKIAETSLEAGVWYHVLAVVKGPLEMDIFIDCENDGGAYSGSGGPLAYTNQPGSIGRKDLSSAPYYFDGAVDQFRYWNRVVTFDELQILCNEKETTKTKRPTERIQRAFLYPNPTEDILRIKTSVLNVSNLEIYNSVGQKVPSNFIIEEEEINVSKLATGLYFVKFLDEEKKIIYTSKFTKI